MSQSNDEPETVQASDRFVLRNLSELIVFRISNGDLLITDVNHTILLKVKPHNSNYHDQRLLVDANNQPIVLLREKNMTAHNRWNAFRGDSTDDSDIIFTIKTPKMIEYKTNLHVFLANNRSGKDACDFKIKGSWSNKNCTISSGDSSQTIAQMQKIQTSGNVRSDEDRFMVTISPNVDYTFVISVIAIIEAMKSSRRDVREIIRSVGQTVLTVSTVAGTVLPFI